MKPVLVAPEALLYTNLLWIRKDNNAGNCKHLQRGWNSASAPLSFSQWLLYSHFHRPTPIIYSLTLQMPEPFQSATPNHLSHTSEYPKIVKILTSLCLKVKLYSQLSNCMFICFFIHVISTYRWTRNHRNLGFNLIAQSGEQARTELAAIEILAIENIEVAIENIISISWCFFGENPQTEFPRPIWQASPTLLERYILNYTWILVSAFWLNNVELATGHCVSGT